MFQYFRLLQAQAQAQAQKQAQSQAQAQAQTQAQAQSQAQAQTFIIRSKHYTRLLNAPPVKNFKGY